MRRSTHFPKLAGSQGPRTRGRKWTEAEFFDEASKRLTPEQLRNVRALYDWATRTGDVSFGTGEKYAGFIVTFPGVPTSRLFKVTIDGALVIRISELGPLGIAFRDALEAAGFPLPPDRKKPAIGVDQWGPALPRLTKLIEELVAGS